MVVKTQLTEQINQKLLGYLQMLDMCCSEFDQYEGLITQHANLHNRSLFQAFVDNQVIPSKIKHCRNNLESVMSPAAIKKQFAILVGGIEIQCMDKIDDIIGE